MNRRLIAATVGLVVLLLGWWLWSDHEEPTVEPPRAQSVLAGDVLAPNRCPPATGPFTPTRIDLPGIRSKVPVVALARDAAGVPGVPPLTTAGKSEFAWDEPPGISPGSPKGNVLLNAHTWPDGTALGNRLLDDLDEGDRIVVRGDGQRLCYQVTRRIEVLASDGYPPYYDTDGPPQVAIVVCSGQRLGPGNWSHRTLWFASPVSG